MPTLNSFDVGDARTTAAILSPTLLAPGPEGGRRDKMPLTVTSELCDGGCGGPEPHQPHDRTFVMPLDDPLLPLGLDSHRYRCCGNGVVAPVAEWLGQRIAEVLT